MFFSFHRKHAVNVSTVALSRDQRRGPSGRSAGPGLRGIDPVEPAWQSITRAAGLPRLQVLLPALLLPGESIGR